MKTGFHLTPAEWQEWAAANTHRAPGGIPEDAEPGNWIVVTDGAGSEWRIDVVDEDHTLVPTRGPLLPGPLSAELHL